MGQLLCAALICDLVANVRGFGARSADDSLMALKVVVPRNPLSRDIEEACLLSAQVHYRS